MNGYLQLSFRDHSMLIPDVLIPKQKHSL